MQRAVIRHAAAIAMAGGLSTASLLAQHTVTVRLRVPTPVETNEQYFLSAEHQQWAPADSALRFARVGDHHELRFPFRSEYFLQFKITRGSDAASESTTEGFRLRPRLAQIKRDTTLDVTVVGWADRITRPSTASRNVSLLDSAFAFPSLGRAHRLWAYLPPGYAATTRRYPVLYLMDGEALFDRATTDDGEEWRVDEILDSLAASRREMIVIGIEGGERRVPEYLPYRTPTNVPTSEGRAFVSDLVTSLMPAMESRLRIAPGRANTAIGGSSMGAFISLFAALEHPDRFGGVAYFSPPQWGGLPMDSLERAAATRGAALQARIMVSTGLREGDAEYAPRARGLARTLARHPRVQTRVRVAPAGEHRPRDWGPPFAEFAAWWLDQRPARASRVGAGARRQR